MTSNSTWILFLLQLTVVFINPGPTSQLQTHTRVVALLKNLPLPTIVPSDSALFLSFLSMLHFKSMWGFTASTFFSSSHSLTSQKTGFCSPQTSNFTLTNHKLTPYPNSKDISVLLVCDVFAVLTLMTTA